MATICTLPNNAFLPRAETRFTISQNLRVSDFSSCKVTRSIQPKKRASFLTPSHPQTKNLRMADIKTDPESTADADMFDAETETGSEPEPVPKVKSEAKTDFVSAAAFVSGFSKSRAQTTTAIASRAMVKPSNTVATDLPSNEDPNLLHGTITSINKARFSVDVTFTNLSVPNLPEGTNPVSAVYVLSLAIPPAKDGADNHDKSKFRDLYKTPYTGVLILDNEKSLKDVQDYAKDHWPQTRLNPLLTKIHLGPSSVLTVSIPRATISGAGAFAVNSDLYRIGRVVSFTLSARWIIQRAAADSKFADPITNDFCAAFTGLGPDVLPSNATNATAQTPVAQRMAINAGSVENGAPGSNEFGTDPAASPRGIMTLTAEGLRLVPSKPNHTTPSTFGQCHQLQPATTTFLSCDGLPLLVRGFPFDPQNPTKFKKMPTEAVSLRSMPLFVPSSTIVACLVVPSETKGELAAISVAIPFNHKEATNLTLSPYGQYLTTTAASFFLKHRNVSVCPIPTAPKFVQATRRINPAATPPNARLWFMDTFCTFANKDSPIGDAMDTLATEMEQHARTQGVDFNATHPVLKGTDTVVVTCTGDLKYGVPPAEFFTDKLPIVAMSPEGSKGLHLDTRITGCFGPATPASGEEVNAAFYAKIAPPPIARFDDNTRVFAFHDAGDQLAALVKCYASPSTEKPRITVTCAPYEGPEYSVRASNEDDAQKLADLVNTINAKLVAADRTPLVQPATLEEDPDFETKVQITADGLMDLVGIDDADRSLNKALAPFIHIKHHDEFTQGHYYLCITPAGTKADAKPPSAKRAKAEQ